MHRLHKLVIGPIADPGLLVRRDVRRIERAERQLEGEAPRERLAALCGMAADAVGGASEIFATRHQVGSCNTRGRAGGIAATISRQINPRAAGKVHWSARSQGKPAQSRYHHHHEQHEQLNLPRALHSVLWTDD